MLEKDTSNYVKHVCQKLGKFKLSDDGVYDPGTCLQVIVRDIVGDKC